MARRDKRAKDGPKRRKYEGDPRKEAATDQPAKAGGETDPSERVEIDDFCGSAEDYKVAARLR